MATCYDCIHCDACSDAGDGGFSCLKEDASKCKHFKNKEEFVEVKHGYWIWLEGNLYECSVCPSKTEVDECMNEPLYEYCPYCGAKMDGDKEGEKL